MRTQPSAISHQPSAKSGGFTLIETIMVMVIIVILAAVVIIRNPFGDIKLYSATRKVAADIRYVQKLSISNQTRAGMVFNANGYSVYPNITDLTTLAPSPGDPCSSWTDISKPLPNIFFVVDFTDANRCSNYSGVTITNITFPANTVSFNSLGTPDNAGSLKVGGNTITVEAGTGRVSY